MGVCRVSDDFLYCLLFCVGGLKLLGQGPNLSKSQLISPKPNRRSQTSAPFGTRLAADKKERCF